MSNATFHRFPCPGCSADMEFDPQSGQLKCPYCGNQQPVPEASEARVEEIPFDETAAKAEMVKLSDHPLELQSS